MRRPADSHGVYPETHYVYEKKRAHYYSTTTGAWIEGTDIWMKTAERYCMDSNYTSRAPTATCELNDEVVTSYEYSANNLFLKGVTVTSPDGTLRTCYQYDMYGNQIGKTQPKANLTSCN